MEEKEKTRKNRRWFLRNQIIRKKVKGASFFRFYKKKGRDLLSMGCYGSLYGSSHEVREGESPSKGLCEETEIKYSKYIRPDYAEKEETSMPKSIHDAKEEKTTESSGTKKTAANSSMTANHPSNNKKENKSEIYENTKNSKDVNSKYVKEDKKTTQKFKKQKESQQFKTEKNASSKLLGSATVTLQGAKTAAKIGASGEDIFDQRKEKQILQNAIRTEISYIKIAAKKLTTFTIGTASFLGSTIAHILLVLAAGLLPAILAGGVIVLVILIVSSSIALIFTPLRFTLKFVANSNPDCIEQYIANEYEDIWNSLYQAQNNGSILVINGNSGDKILTDNRWDILIAYVTKFYTEEFAEDWGRQEAFNEMLSDKSPESYKEKNEFFKTFELNAQNKQRASDVLQQMLDISYGYEEEGRQIIDIKVHTLEWFIKEEKLSKAQLENCRRLIEEYHVCHFEEGDEGDWTELKKMINQAEAEEYKDYLQSAYKLREEPVDIDPLAPSGSIYYLKKLLPAYDLTGAYPAEIYNELVSLDVITNTYHPGDIVFLEGGVDGWEGVTSWYFYVGESYGFTASQKYGLVRMETIRHPERIVGCVCVHDVQPELEETSSEEESSTAAETVTEAESEDNQ